MLVEEMYHFLHSTVLHLQKKRFLLGEKKLLSNSKVKINVLCKINPSLWKNEMEA